MLSGIHLLGHPFVSANNSQDIPKIQNYPHMSATVSRCFQASQSDEIRNLQILLWPKIKRFPENSRLIGQETSP
jgi:hypothetical protein